MAKQCILILGGARSGKSRFAEQLATGLGGRVLFVATAEPLDEEMHLRIERHKKDRPKTWRTVEVPTSVAKAIGEYVEDVDVVILDCLSMLLTNLISLAHDSVELEQVNYDAVEKEMSAELEGLVTLAEDHPFQLIIVSNELGMGLVPVSPVGRAYRDLLGRANQFIARHADRVYLVVAGIPLELKSTD